MVTQSGSFGQLLRRYRQAATLSQEALAARAMLSVDAVSQLESGRRGKPRLETVRLLADALDLSPQERIIFTEAARQLGAAVRAAPALASPSAPPFVGRARELDLLERHLSGEGAPLLAIAGEPGIGKTRLLHAAIPRAANVGLRVLAGGCQQRGGQEPYAPILAAVQRHLQSRRPEQLSGELRGCAWLVRLLPELAEGPIEPLPAWTVLPEHERRLMFAAVTRFLSNVAGPAGTLLVLDDVQWASADALDLLAVLVRAATDVPLHLIAAYRDTDVHADAPLAAMLGDLTAARLATRRQLSPLSPQEAARLLDDLLAGAAAEPALREQVLQRAGGVPFFLVSCAEGLRHGEEDAAHEAVPWDLAQSVRQRVATLSEAARSMLGIAAVIGRTAPYGLLQTVAARPEHELLDALEAACHAHLLEEADENGYRFTHDVIREVVEADLGAARRRLLHRDIAQALDVRAGPPPVEELAYHYARGDQPEQALPYLASAAERARLAAAHQEAVDLLAQAIELARQAGRDDLLGDLHARRGKALSQLTRWPEAHEEMHAALARVPQERGELRAEILVDMAKAGNWLFLDAARIRRYADEALALAEELGREDLAIGALSGLVVADSSDGQLHTGIARYRQTAARAGGRHGDHLAMGAQFAGLMHYWLADFDAAIQLSREAIALSRAAYDTSTTARAQGDLGCALMGSGRYAEALQVFGEGQQESREQGAVEWLARTTLMRAGLHLEVCDYGGAETLAEEARELSRAVRHSRQSLVSGGLDLLLNFAQRGDLGRAEEFVDEAVEGVASARGAHGWLLGLRLAQARAEMALGRGHYEHALRRADDIMARGQAVGRVKYEVAGMQVRAQALAALGRQREAIAHLHAAVARARPTGDPAMFLRPAAVLLTLDGDDALLAEAHAVVERIAAALPEAELRGCFLAAEPVRAVLRLTT